MMLVYFLAHLFIFIVIQNKNWINKLENYIVEAYNKQLQGTNTKPLT